MAAVVDSPDPWADGRGSGHAPVHPPERGRTAGPDAPAAETQAHPAEPRPADGHPPERAGLAPDTPLVGREPEIARLSVMVAEPGLVTVTGEGGVGKTRLVMEVARRQTRPVVFIPLADLDRTGATLAIRRECAPLLLSRFDVAKGTLLDLAREAGPAADPARPRLLVLDSVEQVGQIAGLIAEIRSAVPDLTILVTSRSRLGLSNERVLHLIGLPVDAEGPAVELFLARSRAVGADPAAMRRQLTAITALCHDLDGVPLAIELAAARTRMMSPTALLAQLHSPDHRRVLTLLAKGPADLPKRQLSMRATLGWSHRLLEPAHQVLFRRLAVLPGSFSLDAAEAIADLIGSDGFGESADRTAAVGAQPDDVLDGIAAMVDLHLIEPVKASTDPEPVRFAMSDVARAFAGELLAESGDLPQVQHRLAHWCLDLLGRAEAGVASLDEQLWLDRIAGEMPAIRQALATCAADGDPVLGLRLCIKLGPHWSRQGSPAEGIGWYRTFLDATAEPRPTGAPAGSGSPLDRLRRLALGWWARLALDAGDLTRVEQIRAARPAVIDRHRTFEWLGWTDNLVLALLLMGEFEEGGRLIADGLREAQEHGDSYWTCVFLLRRAFWRFMAARCAQDHLAYQWARMAHVAATDCGLVRLAARAALITGLSLMAGRDWAGADHLLTRNVVVLRAAGDTRGVAMALNLLGMAMIELDRPRDAANHLIEAIGQARRCDDRLGEITAAWAVSFLACRMGRHADVAVAVDAVTENARLLARVLPAPVLADSRRAFEAIPRRDPQPRSDGEIQGWGWLPGWALGIATDIGTAPPGTAGVGDGGVGDLRAGATAVFEPAQPARLVPAGSPRVAITTGPAEPPTDGPSTAAIDHPSRAVPATATPAPGRASHGLTARELEILAAIASGRTNAQIATDFFLSTKTVMHHSVSIYRKLDVHGRAEAVALAYRTGLLQSPVS